MVKITEMTISRSVRINTGNYEGTEHFVSMKAEVDELDDPGAVHVELNRAVELAMLEQLRRSYKVRGKKDMEDWKNICRHHGLTYAPADEKKG